ncbi:protein of unknown function [Streptococcus sanguinis]|uniref:Uncharacterized protein n=1 Tax=Streptococcus sanguinis TaxID=1305 RepID=A0A0B7GN79_STRSA|nr:protein of unknown function [Streptococcus sanguinis]
MMKVWNNSRKNLTVTIVGNDWSELNTLVTLFLILANTQVKNLIMRYHIIP